LTDLNYPDSITPTQSPPIKGEDNNWFLIVRGDEVVTNNCSPK